MNTPGTRAILGLCLLLGVAAALQGLLAPHLFRWGGQPDFVFPVVMTAALLSDASLGCLLGLGGGLLTGALVGETVGTFLVTRTFAGFAAGSFAQRMFRANLGVAVLSVIVASVVSESLYILSAPRVGFQKWLWSALIGTAWNAVLAVPATLILRRLGWGWGRL